MKNKEFELRVMQYFTENINLQKNWEVAKQCAREIIDLRFNDILTGNFDIPAPDEVKEKVSGKVPYEFDSSDFMQNGPVDFSGLEDDMLQDALKKIEAIYHKFHQAQTKIITKAALNVCSRLIDSLKNEISNLKNKYLS
ncbi:MAG: hypothetical protein COX19_10030 [Desulfobacterales bacterium CG23_combo_of_CG06-09_8_20_14_all_51_8]|nr:MAG: hypothetical protein COX19_10030 [Desulfobacterales bacterium CG23_combo_of_CG06-09_8_20_14_all_51_8]